MSESQQRVTENEEDHNINHTDNIRRTLTVRSNTARHLAVNFMPSRQISYNTIRLRRGSSEHNVLLDDASQGEDVPDGDGGEASQVDRIVREMEQHQSLMEDSPQSEELRREALRDLPQGLTLKRDVHARLSASVSLRSRSKPISFLMRMRYRTSFAWKRARDRIYNFIFSIELWYEAIRNIEGHMGSAVGSYFRFLRFLFVMDLVLLVILVCFLVVPQSLYKNGDTTTTFQGLITGKGFTDSLLFYGHYHDGDISSGNRLNYNMPLAYMFSMLVAYFALFAVLCIRTAYSYRRNFIETAGGIHQFANKIFCGWDFGIATSHAAARNSNSVYNELKELLHEQTKKQVDLSLMTRIGQYSVNTAVTVLVLTVMGAVEYGLWQLLGYETSTRHWELLVAAAVTVALLVCPVMWHYIVRLEYYKPRTALYVTLARTWLLLVGTLMLIFYYWARKGTDCWETSFGQETYRLVLLDSVFSLVILPAIELTRGFLFKRHHIATTPEFNMVLNSFTVIYNQAVLWIGMMYSPLLVVSVTVKFLLLFYVKRATVLKACHPARKVWRAAQMQTVLYMLVTLSLFTTLFGVGSIFLRMPSKHCGPFRSYNYVYEVLSEGALQLSSHKLLSSVIYFATRPGVIAFVIMLLCVLVYYMRAKASGQQHMVSILRNMLVLQAKDKDFLLRAIAKVSNGEWMYSPKINEEEHPNTSFTWRYLNEVRKPSNAEFHFDASRLNHSALEGRPKSYGKDRGSAQYADKTMSKEDGDTDSSFSWKGSGQELNESGTKKWQ